MFFADAFAWTLDPKRHPGSPLRPWITLPFQEEVFGAVEESFGDVAGGEESEAGRAGHDLVLFKSRDMGCTHIPLICVDRRFLLYDYQVFVFVSASEELVDDKANPNAIFPKIDLIHSRLPGFFTRDVERCKLQFTRPGVLSIIDGMATTGNVSRSGRPHGVVVDEYAAWPAAASLNFNAASLGATDCRLFISTPQGMGNGFHQVATNPAIPRIDLHWTKHPWHAQGLYRTLGVGGELELTDRKFWSDTRLSWLQQRYPLIARRIKGTNGNPPLRECYPFYKDGRVRSPFYDHMWLRSPFPWIVAQELDLDFVGSGSPFYDHERFQDIMARFCQVPFRQGSLSWDGLTFDPIGFVEQEYGPLELWLNLTLRGNKLLPPAKRFQVSADVSAGTGASNSCLSVWDLVTREKVASFVRSDLRPERFAEAAYAVGKWFGEAQIIAEGQGHGKDFHARLRELGYNRLFWMVNVKGKRSEHPGLFVESRAKESLLLEFGRAVIDGEAICRDRRSLEEGLQFQLRADGKAEHVAALTARNPGASPANHGDRWMADCLAWFRVKQWKNVARHEIEVEERKPTEAEELISEEEHRYARSRW
jgi:hypothetical protein